MNLILFESGETDRPLPRTDARAVHLLDVLRRQPGDLFDAGLVNGPRGKGRLDAINAGTLSLSFTWESAAPAPEPIALVIGLPRPQTARKILQEATALGVGAMHFVTTEKGDPGYAGSTLWTGGEWQRHLFAGAAQAFSTQIPPVTFGRPLAEILLTAPAGTTRIALDNYEATVALSGLEPAAPSGLSSAFLALGPERGWSNPERELLRQHGFVLAHLGTRVLRTETACIVALALVRTRLGLL